MVNDKFNCSWVDTRWQ